jgi:hypothetical protein
MYVPVLGPPGEKFEENLKQNPQHYKNAHQLGVRIAVYTGEQFEYSECQQECAAERK